RAHDGELLLGVQCRVLAREDARAHRARVAQATGDRARVDTADADDVAAHELVVEAAGRPVVGDDPGGVAHDEARDPDALRLGVFLVDARVADVRRRHDDDLPGVARIRQGLLVAGHAGREDGLAEGATARAVGPARVPA